MRPTRTPAPPPTAAGAPNCFCVGLDLGRQVDPSALALLQWRSDPPPRPVAFAPRPLPGRPVYEVPTLVRWPMGTPYREIVKAVARFFKSPPLCAGRAVLVIDATGVGEAVYEMALEQMIEEGAAGGVCAVTITAGNAVTLRQDGPGGRWNVAKKQIASTLQALLASRRLLISEVLAEARTLKDELGKFTVKITDALNETYEAWRENEHDDLVLAVGLAAWAAEKLDHFKPPPPPAEPRRLRG